MYRHYLVNSTALRLRNELGVLLAYVLLVAFSQSTSASPSQEGQRTGADAVRAIDWSTVTSGSPIPTLMPAYESDDPLDAGFAEDWVQRALGHASALPLTLALQRKLPGLPAGPTALKIIASPKAADDTWAHSVEDELRQTIHARIDSEAPTTSRVFCSSEGCLCYVERRDGYVGESMNAILAPFKDNDRWVKDLDIRQTDVYFIAVGANHVFWLLVYVLHSSHAR